MPHHLTDDLSCPASFRRNLTTHLFSKLNFSVTDWHGQTATAIHKFLFDGHSYLCNRDIGNLGRAGLSPRHGNRPPTGNCDPRTTLNSVSTSASFGGNSTRQRLLRDGDISALGFSGHLRFEPTAITIIMLINNNLFACVASWAITVDVVMQLAC